VMEAAGGPPQGLEGTGLTTWEEGCDAAHIL